MPELPPPQTIIQGDKLDMNELYAIFAMKTKPDDTINRIKALEEHAKDVDSSLKEISGSVSQHGTSLEALNQRVGMETEVAAEKKDSNHERRVKDLEDAVKELRDLVTGMPTEKGGPEIDTAQIMMRINMLNVEVNKKIDIIVCNQQMENMNVSIRDTMTTMSKTMVINQDKHNGDID